MADVSIIGTTGVDTSLWLDALSKITVSDVKAVYDIFSHASFEIVYGNYKLTINGNFYYYYGQPDIYYGDIDRIDLSDERGTVAQFLGLSADFRTFYNNIIAGKAVENLLSGANRTWNFYGEAGNDSGTGGDNADVLIGYGGADTLKGGLGDDRLVGGSVTKVDDGVTPINFDAMIDDGLKDVLTGGGGNDIYHVGIGDQVIELGNGGTDEMRSSVNATIAAEVEKLTLLGTGDFSALGNAADNILIGNTGNNQISGLGGNDTMTGGAGNDTYEVDSALDVVTETEDQGDDTIKSSVSLTLAIDVEHLVLTGSGNINATGRDIGFNADELVGNSGKNILMGLGGADVLKGGAGSDMLDGGTGQDTMTGGDGSDVYKVDNTKDVVTETSASLAIGGKDAVQSSINYVLGTNVEDLLLLAPALKGTGNGLANAITGNSLANTLSGLAGADTLKGEGGVDSLIGGEGADTLYGGTGNDVFKFVSLKDSAATSTNLDLLDDIMDFKRGADDIDLSGLDANATVSGNQTFKLDANGDFKAGEIKLVKSGANMIVLVNTDADAAAELAIRVMAVSKLDAGDFIL